MVRLLLALLFRRTISLNVFDRVGKYIVEEINLVYYGKETITIRLESDEDTD